MTLPNELKSNFNYVRLTVFVSIKLSSSFNIDSLNTQPKYMTVHKCPILFGAWNVSFSNVYISTF